MLLITREIENSITMIEALLRYNLDFFIEPILVKNIAYDEIISSNIEDSILIITSYNAINNINDEDKRKLISHIRYIITLTYSSKKIIENLGFKNVISVNGNVDVLLQYIIDNVERNKKILYIRGKNISYDIKSILIKYDFNHVTESISYRMDGVKFLSEDCIRKFESFSIISILLLSLRTSKIFFSLVNRYKIQEYIKKCNIITNSNKVVEYIQRERIITKDVYLSDNKASLDETLKLVSSIHVNDV